jgi:hypothetical protein
VIVVAGAALAGLTLVAAGCGGSSGAKVAQVGTTSGANGSGSSRAGSGDRRAYAACMRSHGVPGFPDPNSSGRIQLPPTFDPQTPAVRAAYRACQSLAQSGGSLTGQGDSLQQDQLLAFAKCMRSHGVPAFPDPQAVNGHINFPATAAGAVGVVCALSVRGVLGISGRTDLVSPGSSSPRFRALDRKVYSPLCVTIAALAAPAAQPARG